MLAQNLDLIQSKGLGGDFKGGNNIGEFISNSGILDYIFAAAGILLLIYLVMSGLQMMTSRGDPKAMQGAQAKITNALLGFVIVFAAYWIVQIIGEILGIGLINAIFT